MTDHQQFHKLASKLSEIVKKLSYREYSQIQLLKVLKFIFYFILIESCKTNNSFCLAKENMFCQMLSKCPYISETDLALLNDFDSWWDMDRTKTIL